MNQNLKLLPLLIASVVALSTLPRYEASAARRPPVVNANNHAQPSKHYWRDDAREHKASRGKSAPRAQDQDHRVATPRPGTRPPVVNPNNPAQPRGSRPGFRPGNRR